MNPIEQLAKQAAGLPESTPATACDDFTRGVLADIRAAERPDAAAWGVAASLAAAAALLAVVLSIGSWASLSNPLSTLNDNAILSLESQ